MGEDTDSTAARRMRLLESDLAPGRRGPRPERTAPTAQATTPLDLGVYDHLEACLQEVETHTRAVVPDAGDIPAERAGVYEWAREHILGLPEYERRAHDVIVYRQSLEHAIRGGNTKVVRKHPCPRCGCWGLFWLAPQQRAVCTYEHCVDDEGMSSSWTLKTLAHAHIRQEEKRRLRAT